MTEITLPTGVVVTPAVNPDTNKGQADVPLGVPVWGPEFLPKTRQMLDRYYPMPDFNTHALKAAAKNLGDNSSYDSVSNNVDYLEINMGLLTATVTELLLHPHEHQQGAWRCNTGMCLAGWGITLVGGQWANVMPLEPYGDHLVYEPDVDTEDNVLHPEADGCPEKVVDAETRGDTIFGLTNVNHSLFESSNTRGEILRQTAELMNRYADALDEYESAYDGLDPELKTPLAIITTPTETV